jgi:hypothetical protein
MTRFGSFSWSLEGLTWAISGSIPTGENNFASGNVDLTWAILGSILTGDSDFASGILSKNANSIFFYRATSDPFLFVFLVV